MTNKSYYNKSIPNYGEIMTIEEFKYAVKSGSFNDDDGHGEAICNNRMHSGLLDNTSIYPSSIDTIPKDATHIIWFNK